MTKQEVASLLGISLKTIERYVSKGRLSVYYKKSPTGGREAVYNDQEVLSLQERMTNTTAQNATTKRHITTDIDIGDRQNVTSDANPETTLTFALSTVLTKQLEVLAIIGSRIEALHTAPTKQLDLHLLSISEAATVTNLPENFLKMAIQRKGKGKRLKAIEIAQDEYRIRQTDLKRFIAKL